MTILLLVGVRITKRSAAILEHSGKIAAERGVHRPLLARSGPPALPRGLQWHTYFGHISRSVECPLLAVSEERKVGLKKPRIIVADDDEDQTNRCVSTSHGE